MTRSRDIANLLGTGSVILDGAPSALDTLNELAAALGDDANFASTITTSLNNRVLTTGGSTVTVSSGTTVPLTIQNNGTGRSFVVNDVASDTTPFVIDAGGEVGIGTDSPSYKLDVDGTARIGGATSNQGTSIIANGAVSLQTNANWNFSGLNIVRTSSNTSSPRFIGMPLGGDALDSTTLGSYNQIWGLYDSVPETTSTSSALNGVMAYGAFYGHRWYNNGTEYMRIDNTGKAIVKGTTVNSGPARLELQSQGDSTSFYNKEVFRVSVSGSAQEITRMTLSGINGFRAYFKIIVTGHNGGVGNGINIKEFYWDGGTSAPVQISTYTQGSFPTISFNNTTNNVCIVNLAAASVGFQGTMVVEWIMPRDYSGNTGIIS